MEVNFDGLVGPTHNYGGLSLGNLASTSHAQYVSNPKAAALQGLSKMHFLMSLGIPQAVLPPHERPNLSMLRSLGFHGSDIAILNAAYDTSKNIFTACYSSSSMWAANAATVSPSMDTEDQKLHITPANLVANFHRSQETKTTHRVLKRIFHDKSKFKVHTPLPSLIQFSDEGAANYCRFSDNDKTSGLELFVYGRKAFGNQTVIKFPARQTKEASQAIARRHLLNQEHLIFARQNPAVIEQGVFHNDVISVANQNVFLFHEEAFENTSEVIDTIQKKLTFPLFLIPVSAKELSVQEAVRTYLFNSQIVTEPDGTMLLIAPLECAESEAANAVLMRIIEEDNPIKAYAFVDCRQSMQNGGGPACLRLRVPMTVSEKEACLSSVFLTENLYQQLVNWVHQYYRDKLAPQDLLDPLLLEETQAALSALSDILGLGSFYSFQE